MAFRMRQNDLNFIFELCVRSPYIEGNRDYKKKARATEITLKNDDDINAYAQSLGGSKSSIKVLTGLCNIAIPLAFALAAFKLDNDINDLTHACNIIADNSNFPIEKVNSTLIKLGYDVKNTYINEEARSYFTGMMLAVVAHELGHICLSHCIRDDGSFETSRNDERSADLFAQSIISSTPFGGYLILSSLFIEILFTWMNKNNTGPATTHPHSRERVMNTLNSHEQYLNEIGITKDTIEDFLP